MATQTDTTPTVIAVEDVGRAFVTRFYELLHSSPEFVYCFYTDQSTISRPGLTGDMVTVTTIEEINNLILSLDYTKYKFEMLTADTQASHMNGVTVLVTGCLTGQDNIKRNFIESFFLAPQETGYFVLNNTFRFTDNDRLPVTNSVEEKYDKIAPAAPVSEVALVQETAEVSDSSLDCLENHTAEVKEIVETTIAPVEQEKTISMEKVVPQPSVDSSIQAQPAVEALSNGDVNAPKKSYASLLMNGKPGSSAFPVHVRAAAAKPLKQSVAPKSVSSGQQTQAATVSVAAAPVAANGSNGNAKSNGHASSNGHVAAKGHSIYIGHLPYDATPELVEREFKQFGRIKKNGIQVRSNKGYVFGFVEYEDVSAQENALKMGTIQIGDREIQIEEKRTASRADDYSSGRGGYRNDGYRCGNYSNGRGNSRNDYGKRNGEGPPRGGRGNGDGVVHQNGGGRGNGDGVVHQNGGGRGARQGGGVALK